MTRGLSHGLSPHGMYPTMHGAQPASGHPRQPFQPPAGTLPFGHQRPQIPGGAPAPLPPLVSYAGGTTQRSPYIASPYQTNAFQSNQPSVTLRIAPDYRPKSKKNA